MQFKTIGERYKSETIAIGLHGLSLDSDTVRNRDQTANNRATADRNLKAVAVDVFAGIAPDLAVAQAVNSGREAAAEVRQAKGFFATLGAVLKGIAVTVGRTALGLVGDALQLAIWMPLVMVKDGIEATYHYMKS